MKPCILWPSFDCSFRLLFIEQIIQMNNFLAPSSRVDITFSMESLSSSMVVINISVFWVTFYSYVPSWLIAKLWLACIRIFLLTIHLDSCCLQWYLTILLPLQIVYPFLLVNNWWFHLYVLTFKLFGIMFEKNQFKNKIKQHFGLHLRLYNMQRRKYVLNQST